MLSSIKKYPRETFELACGYESKARHPYHLDYIDQNKRTWMGYIPVWGQIIYGMQLVWLFKKNVSDNIPMFSPDWTARFIRSILIITLVLVPVVILLDGIGTFMIHLHSKEKNAENLYYVHLI